MPTEINGVPLHPLVVHAVVVLVPLVAVGTVIIAFVPRWRVRYGVPLVALAAGAVVSSLLARHTGLQLRDQVGESDKIERHADLGTTFWIFAAVQLATLAVLVGLQWKQDHRTGGGAGAGSTPSPSSRSSPVLTGAAVIAVIASLAATVQVVRVGDAGAQAVWTQAVTAPGIAEGGVSS